MSDSTAPDGTNLQPAFIQLLVEAYTFHGIRLVWHHGYLMVYAPDPLPITQLRESMLDPLASVLGVSINADLVSILEAKAHDRADRRRELLAAIDEHSVALSAAILDGTLVLAPMPHVLGPGGGWVLSLFDPRPWERTCLVCGWPIGELRVPVHAACRGGR